MKENKIEVKPYLKTHQLNPENQETPIYFLRQWYTPSKYFYRRNHFTYPMAENNNFFLQIKGFVNQPMIFQYKDLLSMPSKTVVVPLECSGNKRAFYEPKVFGEQWEGGAISQGVWKGVSLIHILNIVGINPSAKEIVFTGADFGPRTDLIGYFSFSRSLPLNKALHPDTLIAYELNGKPIPFKHGHPLRLIVPQWYAMASVKWLNHITLVGQPFQGPFQTIDYVYYPDKESDFGKKPVTTMRVNSIIQKPLDYQLLNTGKQMVNGIAWTGKGRISKVEISTDNGNSWNLAKIYEDQSSPYAWTAWSYVWSVKVKGEYTILSKATDSSGRSQPSEAEWNRKGYGYNAISKIKVKVE